jgi:rubrerythrin
MDKEDIKQLERMIEVIMSSIPKERQSHDTYFAAARDAKTEMARQLFDRLAVQEEQHEAKLRAILEILKEEYDTARGKVKQALPQEHEIHDEGLSDNEKIKDIERVMEVVLRMIPKERSARELYSSTSRMSKREMTRSLFETLAGQEQEHENKLRGILELFKAEIGKIRAGKSEK